MDILNYIAPGCSYEKFVKAYDCELQKGYFPYDYMISLDKLKDTELPPHSAFYSLLKQTNISSDEYEYCKQVWDKNNMSTMANFLAWYNNNDTMPFLEAIEKQSRVYENKNICMFKDGVSVPSRATRYLFQESDTSSLFYFINRP